jgi:hypothetical protein
MAIAVHQWYLPMQVLPSQVIYFVLYPIFIIAVREQYQVRNIIALAELGQFFANVLRVVNAVDVVHPAFIGKGAVGKKSNGSPVERRRTVFGCIDFSGIAVAAFSGQLNGLFAFNYFVHGRKVWGNSTKKQPPNNQIFQSVVLATVFFIHSYC